ncbi:MULTISPECIES: hypothetical protein [Corynebacterium]|uniref:hypothetical protein n=1 Tax=Corynebacterium TaxID=1716 RepID=UPI0003044D42|nr:MULTISPECIES: hypothetical protein [Corynebacterium]
MDLIIPRRSSYCPNFATAPARDGHVLRLGQPKQHAFFFRRHLHLVMVLPSAFDVGTTSAREQATCGSLFVTQRDHLLSAQRSDPALCGDHTSSVPHPRHEVEDKAT